MALLNPQHTQYAEKLLNMAENGSHLVGSEKKFLWRRLRAILNASDSAQYDVMRSRIENQYQAIFGNKGRPERKKTPEENARECEDAFEQHLAKNLKEERTPEAIVDFGL